MSGLEFRLVSPEFEDPLKRLFNTIHENGDASFFHPHPFTDTEAHQRATYTGKDLYYISVSSTKLVVGYGLLRGWDEGFNIPSLGIIIHPEWRGTGLGYVFMQFLHQAAKDKGAEKIRLKVYPENVSARALYEKLGYVFENTLSDNQLVGFKSLK